MKRAIYGDILNIQRLLIVESQTIDQVNVEKKKWVNKSIFLWKVLWIREYRLKIKNTYSTSIIKITMMILDRGTTLDQIRRCFSSLNYSGSLSWMKIKMSRVFRKASSQNGDPSGSIWWRYHRDHWRWKRNSWRLHRRSHMRYVLIGKYSRDKKYLKKNSNESISSSYVEQKRRYPQFRDLLSGNDRRRSQKNVRKWSIVKGSWQ